MKYIDIKCPNIISERNKQRCGRKLSPISVDTFKNGVDLSILSRCPSCKEFWEISYNKQKGLIFTKFPKNGNIDLVPITDVFAVYEIDGEIEEKA